MHVPSPEVRTSVLWVAGVTLVEVAGVVVVPVLPAAPVLATTVPPPQAQQS